MSKNPMTTEQLAALKSFATECGPGWKDRLMLKWLHGNAPNGLHVLRYDAHTWFNDFSFDEESPTHEVDFRSEVEEALRSFAARKGRYWKDKLYTLWGNGRDCYESEGSTLRAIRNHSEYGHDFVRKFKTKP